ncbi:MAG: helix-turn-helix transcriptional regulator [Pirellulales bacterium]|nr:helix-turn-helix transcriptional regulator [Pirellulales bacterium]
MAIEKETLGAAIKRVRLARGLTQVQLAETAGLSKGGNSIALIEQGKRFVSVDTLNALAEALDVPVACLAILGSRKIGTNKAATDFMHSLQKVISTVIAAQESAERGVGSEQKDAYTGAKKPSKSKPARRLVGK